MEARAHYIIVSLSLLIFTFQSAASNDYYQVTYCVKGVKPAVECSALAVNYTVNQLSDIADEDRSQNITIYLTSEEHFLSTNLTVEKGTKPRHFCIQGILNSTITCRDGAAFQIHSSSLQRKSVYITNVAFNNCFQVWSVDWKNRGNIDILVTLYLANVDFILDNVRVANTSGVGLLTYNCFQQIIRNCEFINNNLGNVKVRLKRQQSRIVPVNIAITNTIFSDSYTSTSSDFEGGGGLQVKLNQKIRCDLIITRSRFYNNRALYGSHLLMEAEGSNTSIDASISNSTFSRAGCPMNEISNEGCTPSGTSIRTLDNQARIDIRLHDNEFSDNDCGAIEIRKVNLLELRSCLIENNNGTGLTTSSHKLNVTNVTISKTRFHNNSKALNVTIKSLIHLKIIFSNFTHHELTSSLGVVEITGIYSDSEITIQNSLFEGNYNSFRNCSVLLLHCLIATLRDIVIQDNDCSGISLNGSTVIMDNNVSIVQNTALLGGAIKLESSQSEASNFSRFIISNNALLNFTNNRAIRYGGGIFTDETCENRAESNQECFIQFQKDSPESLKQLQLLGNTADIGGDMIFQGCLSECYYSTLFTTSEYCQKSDNKSSSTIAEYPTRVAFCPHTISACGGSPNNCTREYMAEAYPGEEFEVPLMVVDDRCVPSVGIVQAKPQNSISLLSAFREHETELLVTTRKYCSSYKFVVIGKPTDTFSTIDLFFFSHNTYFTSSPAKLLVNLTSCPIGFRYDNRSQQCDCHQDLTSVDIKCIPANHSLLVPRQTWIGTSDGAVKVGQFCMHCSNQDIWIGKVNQSNSDGLCNYKRTKTLCGTCSSPLSLQIGGYNCQDCTNSTYIGILLLLTFLIVGILLILALLSLNLTVSSGVINALIFYSNIVYSHQESFLPQAMEQKHLHRVVLFLTTFQAWVNLDLGIPTCFFDGYDIYISTWLQFLFPLYIWLLILAIVLASRYSIRVSRLMTSGTVPVLATLLLLSYTKLFIASISALSFTKLTFLSDSSKTNYVWVLDGNIFYLQGKHIPLFMASVLWIAGYILPFTLLILLGPILQTKSEYRFLRWVNKLKPLLDAFYGPYTSRYRYWPGILLLARLTLFFTAAFYSLGDGPYKLVIVTCTVTVLLIIWVLLAKRNQALLYHSMSLNYLELFFSLNLVIFSVSSIYFRFTKKKNLHQQVLAVVMVGAAFIVFCGILMNQLISKLRTLKVTKGVIRHVPTQRVSRLLELVSFGVSSEMNSEESDYTCTASAPSSLGNAVPTQSYVDYITNSNAQMREPLLTD